MDLLRMIYELRSEKELLDEAIQALERVTIGKSQSPATPRYERETGNRKDDDALSGRA
jgi:hypothetical protein